MGGGAVGVRVGVGNARMCNGVVVVPAAIARQVADAAELEKAVATLLTDPPLAAEMGEAYPELRRDQVRVTEVLE